jgi:hypothetical protein
MLRDVALTRVASAFHSLRRGVRLALPFPIASIGVVTDRVAVIAARGGARLELVGGAAALAVAVLLDVAFAGVRTAYRARGFRVQLALTIAVTGVRVVTDGIAVISTSRTARLEGVARTTA